MKHINRYLILIMCLFLVLSFPIQAEEAEQTFHLKSGDKIMGVVTSYDEETKTYTVKTDLGMVDINKSELSKEVATFWLKNGNKIIGAIHEETNENYVVETAFGRLAVPKNSIEQIVIQGEQKDNPIKRLGELDRWIYGDEQLIDLFYDPTGYTLKDSVLYASAISWGYGVTDRLQISTKYWDDIFGNLNLRFKYNIHKSGNVNSQKSASIGFHINQAGSPNKYIYTNYNGSSSKSWEKVGSVDDSGEEKDDDEMWYEFFGAYTISKLKKSQKGRINYTVGGSIVSYPGFSMMPRAYLGMDIDLRKNFKLITEVFYDEYWPNSNDLYNDEEMKTPIHLDFGFIYAYDKHKRIGFHFQRPYYALYYKF